MTDDELHAFIEGLEWQQKNASGVTLEEWEIPAVLQALRQMRDQQWRTIDSAPKDGFYLICKDVKESAYGVRDALNMYECTVAVASMLPDGGFWVHMDEDDCLLDYLDGPATHWMPLPQPPEDTK